MYACMHCTHAAFIAGIKTEFACIKDYTKDYISFIQRYGTADLEKTIYEIHHSSDEPDDEPIRMNQTMPDWDCDECYHQDKLVLETCII